jgi:succinate dehydrogenase / fumarate reductase, iron-sulfur subunit
MAQKYSLTLNIQRYDPNQDSGWTQEYKLEAGRIQRFTDLLRQINDEQDPTLAWNSSCEHGQCGSCAVVVNGKPLLACELLVENAVRDFGTTSFTVGPITAVPVVRDLVADLEKGYERVDKAKPYLIKPGPPDPAGHEYIVQLKQLDRYADATRCLNCFCCATACITSNRTFLGPNAVMAGVVRLMDPREEEKKERLKLVFSEQGVYRCHTSQACSHVCPKEIDVAHYMALAKEGRFEAS